MKKLLITFSAFYSFFCFARGKATKYEGQALYCLIQDQVGQLELKKFFNGEIPTDLLVIFDHGIIQGTTPNPPHEIHIIVLSNDKKSGVLFFVDIENQKYIVIRNAYHLYKTRNHWEANEGNGGIATYIAIGRYISGIMRRKNIHTIIRHIGYKNEQCM